MERLGAVPHATFVYGPGLTGGAGGQRRALALHELVRALCHERHVVTLELPRAPGRGARMTCWPGSPGTAGAVDFAGGHPELVTATQPLRRGVDVTLLVGARRPAGAAEIALAASRRAGVEVWIRTAAAGVSAAGTVHRLDGVPLTLQAPLQNGAPTAAALLDAAARRGAARDRDPDQRRRRPRPRQRRRRRDPRRVPERTARWSPTSAPTRAGSTRAGWW